MSLFLCRLPGFGFPWALPEPKAEDGGRWEVPVSYPKSLTKPPFRPHSPVCHMKWTSPCPSSGGNQRTRPPLHSSPRHPAFSRSSVSIVSLQPPWDLHFLTWGVCDIPGAIIRGFHSFFPEGIRSRSFSAGLEVGVREPVWTGRPPEWYSRMAQRGGNEK